MLTWRSQPNQSLANPHVRRLIEHDSERGNVHLFLRTREPGAGGTIIPYTYPGRLDYHRQARPENAFFRYKSIFGGALRARSPGGQVAEALVACNVLNQMTELGRPDSYAIGR